jgi:hypothetical protein
MYLLTDSSKGFALENMFLDYYFLLMVKEKREKKREKREGILLFFLA